MKAMLLSAGLFVMAALDPAMSAQSVREALQTWAFLVVPALLPFLAAVPALTSAEACALLGGVLRPVMRFIGCPAEWGAAYLTGLLSGSPAGALAAVRAASRKPGTRGALLRLAVAASGASPAFLSSVAGRALGGRAGWGLVLAQSLAALSTARLMRPLGSEVIQVSAQGQNRQDNPLVFAARTLLMIGMTMAIFALPSAWGARLFGESARGGLMMLMELNGGCSAVSALAGSEKLKTALMAAVCCVGGASVCAQCLGALCPAGIRAGEYVYWKLVHAALSALYALPLCRGLREIKAVEGSGEIALAALGVTVVALGVGMAFRKRLRQATASEIERKVSLAEQNCTL